MLTMTFSAPHLLNSVNPRDHSVDFAVAPWLSYRYELDDNIVMRYVHGDYLRNNIFLRALDRDEFCSHMCALEPNWKLQILITDCLEKEFLTFMGPLSGAWWSNLVIKGSWLWLFICSIGGRVHVLSLFDVGKRCASLRRWALRSLMRR